MKFLFLSDHVADHRNINVTRLTGTVWWEKPKQSAEFIGFVDWNAGTVKLLDPMRRRTFTTTLDKYDKFDGNFQAFLEHYFTHGEILDGDHNPYEN